jgi:hypothetical protein
MPAVILSMLYQVSRKLLSVPGVLLRRNTSKDAELLVLRHENAVLRRQIAGPVRYQPADRFWLAALSSLIPRRRWREVFAVTPGRCWPGTAGSSRRSGTTPPGAPAPDDHRPGQRSRS